MKTISLYLNTQTAYGPYAPVDKTNLANVKWNINWKELFGEFWNSTKICRVKAKLTTSPTTNQFTTPVNQGCVRASFNSSYANITNGLNLGIPKIFECIEHEPAVNFIISTLSNGSNSITISNTSPQAGRMLQEGMYLPRSVAGGYQFPVNEPVRVTKKTGNYTYTLSQTYSSTLTTSADVAIGATTITLTPATIVNAVIGQTITATTSIPASTTITAINTATNTITISNATTTAIITSGTSLTLSINSSIAVTTLIPNYLELDTIQSSGSTINIPTNNDFFIQFYQNDDVNLQTNIPDYQVWFYFEIDE